MQTQTGMERLEALGAVGQLREEAYFDGAEQRLGRPERLTRGPCGARYCQLPRGANHAKPSDESMLGGRYDVMDRAGDLGIHLDSPPGVLDGQCAGDQSPSGSVVWPTSIR